jgi:hypothetical protein
VGAGNAGRGHFTTVTVDGIEQFVRSHDGGARVIEL